MPYELYGKSKEVPEEVINIKALIFSVSFESHTDQQLVECEEGADCSVRAPAFVQLTAGLSRGKAMMESLNLRSPFLQRSTISCASSMSSRNGTT